MGNEFADCVAIFLTTLLSQKSMEMCFRTSGLPSFWQQLIPTRTLQLMKDTGLLPTKQMSFYLGLQRQGRVRN